MKAKLLLFVMFLINFTAQAQDKIIKKDGTELQVKVEEIQENVVKYRRLNNLTGPMYNVKKTDIAKIIYEKGKEETFVEGNSVVEEKKPSESSPRSIEIPEPPKVEKKVVEVKPIIEEKKVIPVVVEEPKNILNSNTEHRMESDIIPADVMEQKSATNAITKVIGIVMADKDGNEPIEGAIVTLEDGQTAKTNKNGVFNLLVLMGSEIEISHNDFDTRRVKIENAVVSVVLNKALVTFDMSLLKDVRIPQNKAQPIQIAYYYFINNNYKESAKVFEKYAAALSADDVYTWGDCYWKMGKFKEAINDYWTKAAARGNEDANYQLGVYFAELKKDNEKAISLMNQVSQNHKNYSEAQLLLGLLNIDNTLKIKYLTNAANYGNSEAMCQLGEHFKANNDLKMANEWYKNACILKNRKACLIVKDEF